MIPSPHLLWHEEENQHLTTDAPKQRYEESTVRKSAEIANRSHRCFPMFVVTLGALGLAGLCGACDTESETQANLDAITSATPGVSEVILAESHGEGWKRTDCKSCHDTVHTSGYIGAGDCSHCHGSNGAPLRPSGHDDGKCSDSGCHTAETNVPGHGLDGLTVPNDCRGCHRYEKPVDAGSCTHIEDYEVIVVGAGGGGLAAAAMLAKQDVNVLLIEQSYKTGGAMVNFNRGDYRFEASLHATDGLTMPMALSALGIADQVELAESEIMYRNIFPDSTIDIPADVGEYRALLKKEFPDSADGVDSLLDAFDAAYTSYDFSAFAGLTVTEVLAQHGIQKGTPIFAVLTALCSFLAGGPDELPAGLFIGMWNSYHAAGYMYPLGGSQAITTVLTNSILDNFGTIKLHTLVDKIVIEGGKATGVHTQNGGCYNAPYVISNVNLPDTYLKLIGQENLPAALVAQVEAREPAPSNTMLYLGVNDDYSDIFPANAHELFVFLGYDMEDLNMDLDKCDPQSQGFAISNYTMLDPGSAPAGKSVIVVSSVVGYDCNNRWELEASYQRYKELKQEFADQYLPRLEEYLPGISTKIEVMEVATPQTIERYTLNPRGSWEGFDDIPQDQGDNPMNMMADANHLTPIPNLFITGGWATEGAQALVLNSGVTAARLVTTAMAE